MRATLLPPSVPYDWRLRIIARMSSARLLSPSGAAAGAATVSTCGAGAGAAAIGEGVAAGAGVGVVGAAVAVDVLEFEELAGASIPYGR